MKETLKALLKSNEERRDALGASMIESDNKEERAAIGETLKALGEEITEIEKMLEPKLTAITHKIQSICPFGIIDIIIEADASVDRLTLWQMTVKLLKKICMAGEGE